MKETIRILEHGAYLPLKNFSSLTINDCMREIFAEVDEVLYDDFKISFTGGGKSGGKRFFEFEISTDLACWAVDDLLSDKNLNNFQQIFI